MKYQGIVISLIGLVGWSLIALGIYGIYVTEEPFHPAFNNQNFMIFLFAVGIPLVVIEGIFLFKKYLAKRKGEVYEQ